MVALSRQLPLLTARLDCLRHRVSRVDSIFPRRNEHQSNNRCSCGHPFFNLCALFALPRLVRRKTYVSADEVSESRHVALMRRGRRLEAVGVLALHDGRIFPR